VVEDPLLKGDDVVEELEREEVWKVSNADENILIYAHMIPHT
jgi:hypothetical protein